MADWQLEDRTPGKTITGPQGPQGPMGPQGPQGVKGNDGSQGPKGDQGAQGFAGPQGAQGPAGAKGDKGDRGAAGVQGPQGEIGPRGSQGAQGDVGPRGNTGPQGQQGPQGGRGEKGDKGDTGDTGPKGDQGIQGIQGPKGDQGIQGNTGPKGDQGAGVTIKGSRPTPNDLPATGNTAGDTYIMTTSGNGFNSGDGYSYSGTEFVNVGQVRGPQGIQGPKGDTGSQGPKGDTGPQGDTGPKGDTGAAGANGAQGPQGVQGPKGDKGDTGPQGAQGIQGVKGDTGAQGPKGDTGATGPAPDTSTYARLSGGISAYFMNEIAVDYNKAGDGAGLRILSNANATDWRIRGIGDGSIQLCDGGFTVEYMNFQTSGAIRTRQLGDLKTYIDNSVAGRLSLNAGGTVKGSIGLDSGAGEQSFYFYRNSVPSTRQVLASDGTFYTHVGINAENIYFGLFRNGDIGLPIAGTTVKNYVDQKGVPAGVVADYAGSSAPAGWLKCNGAAVSRSAYAALFAAIGTQYGAGDGNSTFNLPDSRGYFRRSLDDGRGIDSNRALGSTQAQDIGPHTHFIPNVTANAGSGGTTGLANNQGGGAPLTAVTSGQPTAGGVETRPVNIAFLAIIKY